MANITIDDFDITATSGNNARFTVDYTVTLSATERRLEIPIHIWVRLMERDNAQDDFTFVYDGGVEELKGTNDDSATGWLYVGSQTNNGPGSFTSADIDRDDLPGESGAEEWYCVAICRPDLRADSTRSGVISLNLG